MNIVESGVKHYKPKPKSNLKESSGVRYNPVNNILVFLTFIKGHYNNSRTNL